MIRRSFQVARIAALGALVVLVRTPVSRFADEWNATSFQTAVGVVVYPFR